MQEKILAITYRLWLLFSAIFSVAALTIVYAASINPKIFEMIFFMALPAICLWLLTDAIIWVITGQPFIIKRVIRQTQSSTLLRSKIFYGAAAATLIIVAVIDARSIIFREILATNHAIYKKCESENFSDDLFDAKQTMSCIRIENAKLAARRPWLRACFIMGIGPS